MKKDDYVVCIGKLSHSLQKFLAQFDSFPHALLVSLGAFHQRDDLLSLLPDLRSPPLVLLESLPLQRALGTGLQC